MWTPPFRPSFERQVAYPRLETESVQLLSVWQLKFSKLLTLGPKEWFLQRILRVKLQISSVSRLQSFSQHIQLALVSLTSGPMLCFVQKLIQVNFQAYL